MLSFRLAAITTAAVLSTAQTLPFDVASVKPNKSQDFRAMRMQSFPGGRFAATNVPLRILICTAYNLPFNQSERLSGIPNWVNEEHYDIEAKAPAGAFPDGMPDSEFRAKMRSMLQALLADRFKLVMRHETKEVAVYALAVAKHGAKLNSAGIEEKDCPVGPTDGITCHNFNGGQGRGLHAKAVNMADLAGYIENWTDHPVVDKTEIHGLFAIETEGWTPMRVFPPLPAGAAPNPGARPSGDGDMSDPARPTLFMVLERLGLDLKQQKAPAEMYVIEHVEPPAAN